MPPRHVPDEGEQQHVILLVLRTITRPCRLSPVVVGRFHVAGHQQQHPDVLQQLSLGCLHHIHREQHVVCCLDDGNLKEKTGEAVEEDFTEGFAIGGPFICKC